MNYLKLTREKIDVEVLSDLVSDETCGAISLFVGTTRNNFEDKKVSHYVTKTFIVIMIHKTFCYP